MSMNMVLATVTTHPNELLWFTNMVHGDVGQHVFVNGDGSGEVAGMMQGVYEAQREYGGCEILAYVHDDVECFDPFWNQRVQAEFADPQVAIVGFGGALGIGLPDIYKTPYRLDQLQRLHYMSNQTDWQTHGAHETGARDVAVLDGFFMAIRLSFLDSIGGWKWFPFNFHCYDTCMCLMALRRGYRVRMVGVECTHHGGGTSHKTVYHEWCRRNNTTPELEHTRPHEWMYREFSDLLPLWVKEGGK